MIRRRKGDVEDNFGLLDSSSAQDSTRKEMKCIFLFRSILKSKLLIAVICCLGFVFMLRYKLQSTMSSNELNPIDSSGLVQKISSSAVDGASQASNKLDSIDFSDLAQEISSNQVDPIDSSDLARKIASSAVDGASHAHQQTAKTITRVQNINRKIADHTMSTFPTVEKCWEDGPRDFYKHPILVIAKTVSSDEPKKNDRCDVPCFYSQNSNLAHARFADGFIDFQILGSVRMNLQCPYAKETQASMESPQHYTNYQIPQGERNHLMMTVELKSDVMCQYYSWGDYRIMDYLEEKTEDSHAASFISNCGIVKSNRGGIISELMNHGVKIDNFGHCLHNKEEPRGPYGGKVNILKRYKFGIAMENSIWPDYVTEKLFQVYEAGAVPIVVGAPNSHDYEPLPGSFIFADDFDSVEDMAKHILYLASNDTAYKEYLRWKTQGPSDKFKALYDISAVHARCRLCIKLADIHVEKYGDLISPPPQVAEGKITFLIRERNTFYFRELSMNMESLNLSALYSAIFHIFDDRLPVWAHDRPASLITNKLTIFRLYRFVGSSQTMYDTLFNDSILIDTDAKVQSLKHGSKLEVIFV